MKRFLPVLLSFLLLLSGCAKEQPPAQLTMFSMNTVMDLKIWGEEGDTAAQQIMQLCSRLEKNWSATDPDSLLSRLNRGEQAELTPEQKSLLEAVEQLSLRTGGAFDPKLHGVSQLWDFTGESPRVPVEKELQAALKVPQWDMGGSLKGYAGQKAAELLATMKVQRAILNLGGNIQTFGEKPDGSDWVIGVQNPDGGDYLGYVHVKGTAAVVTSGDYQRYFEENGVRYHHILDPETGYPAASGLRSVTVICRDGLTADCLSTALFVMGLEEGAAFWRESSDFEAVFVTEDGKIHATEGAGLSGCEYEVIGK